MASPIFTKITVGTSSDNFVVDKDTSTNSAIFDNDIYVPATQTLSTLDDRALVTAKAINDTIGPIQTSLNTLASTVSNLVSNVASESDITTMNNSIATLSSDLQHVNSQLATLVANMSSSMQVSQISTGIYSVKAYVGSNWIEVFEFVAV